MRRTVLLALVAVGLVSCTGSSYVRTSDPVRVPSGAQERARVEGVAVFESSDRCLWLRRVRKRYEVRTTCPSVDGLISFAEPCVRFTDRTRKFRVYRNADQAAPTCDAELPAGVLWGRIPSIASFVCVPDGGWRRVDAGTGKVVLDVGDVRDRNALMTFLADVRLYGTADALLVPSHVVLRTCAPGLSPPAPAERLLTMHFLRDEPAAVMVRSNTGPLIGASNQTPDPVGPIPCTQIRPS